MEEVWKDIKGYEGLYQVSDMGRVKSLFRIVSHSRTIKRTIKEQILSPEKTIHGYYRVCLSYQGSYKRKTNHRLTCGAFVPNPDNKPEVNHINGIKTDNRAVNLEWCNASENAIHAFKLGLRKSPKGIKSGSSKSVYQYSKDYDFIKKWDCIMDIQRDIGIFATSISACCKNKLKTAGGFKWKYGELITKNLEI